MTDINIGAITEALNDKSDRDLRNVDTTAKADAVIDYQEPAAGNNYIWYRKYKSGWVEQGGIITGLTNGSQSWISVTINLPVIMSVDKYTVTTSDVGIGTNAIVGSRVEALSTTSFVFKYYNASNSSVVGWMVCGMAAN